MSTTLERLTKPFSVGGWCASKGSAKEGLLAGIEVLGERKRGKPQVVGKDESRKFLAKASSCQPKAKRAR